MLSAPAGNCYNACAANSSSCFAAGLVGFPVTVEDMAAVIASMGLSSSFCDIIQGDIVLPEDPQFETQRWQFGNGRWCWYGTGGGSCSVNATNINFRRFCPCSYDE